MSWLASRLQELLEDRNLSIQRLARDIGVERAYVSQILHDSRSPSEELTRKLAGYFGQDEEEWAFKTKAEPVMEDFRRRFPNMMPKYARNVTEDRERKPRYEFAARDYLTYNAPSHTSHRQVTEFLPIKTIERFASDTLRLYAESCHVDIDDIDFPLDAELLVRKVFGLDVHYDGEGVLDRIDRTLLGCLYADGHQSPWGKDRLIVVNSARRYQAVTDGFTILHEGGHYLFHHPLDALATGVQLLSFRRFCWKG
jgi:transcriptional regulator with XRE-family HTH domain